MEPPLPTVPPPVVVVAPSPKSPPKYPDLCGRRRLQLQLQILNREIGFIEEELQSLEGSQSVSRFCKEVYEFVGTKPDPLAPLDKKMHRSCCLWRWLRSKLCFNGCMLGLLRPSCSGSHNCNCCQSGCPSSQSRHDMSCIPCCSSEMICSCSRTCRCCSKSLCSCIGTCCDCFKVPCICCVECTSYSHAPCSSCCKCSQVPCRSGETCCSCSKVPCTCQTSCCSCSKDPCTCNGTCCSCQKNPCSCIGTCCSCTKNQFSSYGTCCNFSDASCLKSRSNSCCARSFCCGCNPSFSGLCCDQQCCGWKLTCCQTHRDCSLCYGWGPSCFSRKWCCCSSRPSCSSFPSLFCPEYSCGCVWSCTRCTDACHLPICAKPGCVIGCLC